MTELIDPLAMTAPPPPGVQVIPDEPPAAAPARGDAGPDLSVFYSVEISSPVRSGAEACAECGGLVLPGGRMYRVGARWLGANCAARIADPGREARRLAYQAATGRSDPPDDWAP
jgi:hypothetical protein